MITKIYKKFYSTNFFNNIKEKGELKRNEGFTLIELLLVVAIITLFSSIFFYSSTEARNKAEDAHMTQEVQQTKIALQMYKDDKGSVPYSNNSNPGVYREGTTEYLDSLSILVENGYLSEIPRSPSGENYAYGYTSDHQYAFFVADLNKAIPDNTNNYCSFVSGQQSSEYVFSNCNFDRKSIFSCSMFYNFRDPKEYICFDLSEQLINEKCSCEVSCPDGPESCWSIAKSKTADFPDIGCSSSFDNNSCYNDNLYLVLYCNYEILSTTIPSLCNGTSDFEYCACQ